jgi:hypothetical protein
MKTSTQKLIARLAGLFLLSLLVVALAVPAASARRDISAGAPSTPAGSGTSSAAQRAIGWAWGYYYSDAGASKLAAMGAQRGYWAAVPVSGTISALQLPTRVQVRQHHGTVPSAYIFSGPQTVSGTQSASSGISSTTVWSAAVAVAAVLLIGAWALLRRRRQREALPICEVYPAGC